MHIQTDKPVTMNNSAIEEVNTFVDDLGSKVTTDAKVAGKMKTACPENKWKTTAQYMEIYRDRCCLIIRIFNINVLVVL